MLQALGSTSDPWQKSSVSQPDRSHHPKHASPIYGPQALYGPASSEKSYSINLLKPPLQKLKPWINQVKKQLIQNNLQTVNPLQVLITINLWNVWTACKLSANNLQNAFKNSVKSLQNACKLSTKVPENMSAKYLQNAIWLSVYCLHDTWQNLQDVCRISA